MVSAMGTAHSLIWMIGHTRFPASMGHVKILRSSSTGRAVVKPHTRSHVLSALIHCPSHLSLTTLQHNKAKEIVTCEEEENESSLFLFLCCFLLFSEEIKKRVFALGSN